MTFNGISAELAFEIEHAITGDAPSDDLSEECQVLCGDWSLVAEALSQPCWGSTARHTEIEDIDVLPCGVEVWLDVVEVIFERGDKVASNNAHERLLRQIADLQEPRNVTEDEDKVVRE